MVMSIHSRRALLATAYVIIAMSLWAASRWWEKGLAEKFDGAIISPGKCYRIDSYKPFWVMPTFLHPWTTPDKQSEPEWFINWIQPGFDRLYDNRSGVQLGESEIYDFGRSGGSGIFWGDRSRPGVYAGMIYLGPNSADCIGDQPAHSLPGK